MGTNDPGDDIIKKTKSIVKDAINNFKKNPVEAIVSAAFPAGGVIYKAGKRFLRNESKGISPSMRSIPENNTEAKDVPGIGSKFDTNNKRLMATKKHLDKKTNKTLQKKVTSKYKKDNNKPLEWENPPSYH